MFLHQIYTYFFTQNWTYQESMVLENRIHNWNMKNLWFFNINKTLKSKCVFLSNSSNFFPNLVCKKTTILNSNNFQNLILDHFLQK
jgi:hypothetical protein